MSTDQISHESITDQNPDYHNQIQDRVTLEAREAVTVAPNGIVPDYIADSLPHDLYLHQAEGLKELQDGNHVNVSTRTSSGKTLIYALYAAIQVKENEGTALFIYPTRALAQDQVEGLQDIYSTLGLDITVNVYDGDTPSDRRKRIRRNSDIIITNFAGINRYLPHHSVWSSFFSDLELVAIDESHTYTGVHGMHVAWTLRRLRRVVNYYGQSPQYTFTTATIGNPKEHSEKLLNEEVTVITNDTSPRGKQEVLFWQPPRNPDDDSVQQRPAGEEASILTAHLVSQDFKTIMFTRSRQGTERWSEQARDALSSHPENSSSVANRIRSYNAGLGKKLRRDLESKFKNQDGDIDALVGTNALELGIDIGLLDAVILTGYPGTRQSFWQQIGRAGRGGDDALAAYVGRLNSIDSYIMNNPEYVLEKNMEKAVLDLDNNYVYQKHILAAADELPLTTDDKRWFGDRLSKVVKMHRQADKITGTLETNAQYNGGPNPQENISVYATTDDQYTIRCENAEIDLEPVNKERAYREFHEGAVVLHNGDRYVVTEFKNENRQQSIVLEQVDVDYYTQALSDTRIENLKLDESRDLTENITLNLGTGKVVVNYDKYKKKDIESNEEYPQLFETNVPELELQTELMWLSIDEDHILNMGREAATNNSDYTDVSAALGGIHALEHALISMAPLELRADKDNLGGLSSLQPTALRSGAGLFIYDGIEHGLGFSEKIYWNFQSILERTVDLISGCRCSKTNGCLECVMSDSCGDGNEPLHTGVAAEFGQNILDALKE